MNPYDLTNAKNTLAGAQTKLQTGLETARSAVPMDISLPKSPSLPSLPDYSNGIGTAPDRTMPVTNIAPEIPAIPPIPDTIPADEMRPIPSLPQFPTPTAPRAYQEFVSTATANADAYRTGALAQMEQRIAEMKTKEQSIRDQMAQKVSELQARVAALPRPTPPQRPTRPNLPTQDTKRRYSIWDRLLAMKNQFFT